MSLYHKGKEIGGFPTVDTVVTSDSSNPVSSKAVYNAIAEKASDIAINKSTLGYKCKNLLTYPYLHTTQTIQNVEWTDNGDGTITANGTNDSSDTYSIFNCVTRTDTTMPLFLEAGTYILSGCPSDGGNSTYRSQVGKSTDSNFETLGLDYGEGAIFTLEETTQIQVQLMVGKGATVNNVTFKPMIRYADIEDDTYEVYKPSVDTRLDAIESDIAELNRNLQTKDAIELTFDVPINETYSGYNIAKNMLGMIETRGVIYVSTTIAKGMTKIATVTNPNILGSCFITIPCTISQGTTRATGVIQIDANGLFVITNEEYAFTEGASYSIVLTFGNYIN